MAGTTAPNANGTYNGGHMPSGYTFSRCISCFLTDGAAHIKYYWQYGRSIWFPLVNILNTASPTTSYQSVAFSSVVPPMAKSVTGVLGSFGSSSNATEAAIASDTSGTAECAVVIPTSANPVDSFNTGAPFPDLPLSTPQTLYYKASSGGSTAVTISINGYKFMGDIA